MYAEEKSTVFYYSMSWKPKQAKTASDNTASLFLPFFFIYLYNSNTPHVNPCSPQLE